MDRLCYILGGVAAGIAWYRSLIRSIIGKNPCTMCDYCEFEIKKKQIWGHKKK